jgi:hypothetical protein
MIEDREADIDQEQARDRLVDTAVLPERARKRDPEPAAHDAGANHRNLYQQRRRPRHGQGDRCRGQGSDQQRAFAADDDHAELRGQGGTQRRQDQRCRACQRVLPGEPGAERALIHVEIQIERVLAEQCHENAEYGERADQRRARDQDVFDGCAVALEKTGVGGRRDCDRLDRIRSLSCHEVAPITPSTR